MGDQESGGQYLVLRQAKHDDLEVTQSLWASHCYL